MRKVVRILLLSFIFIIPIYVNAEDNNKVEVYFNIPANITFKNEDLVIKEEVNCGERLLEPSHVEIDGYIFKGWYNGDEKWDLISLIKHRVTKDYQKIPYDKHGYKKEAGKGEKIPLSFYFDLSGSMNKYIGILCTLALKILRKGVKIISLPLSFD